MQKLLLTIVLTVTFALTTQAQSFPYLDDWKTNPLGFKPLELHAGKGFLLPAIAVGVILLTTDADSGFTKKLELYNQSGISWGYKYPYTTVFQNSTGINYFLREYLSVGVEIGLFFPKDSYNKEGAIYTRPFARFYMLNNESRRVFFESGGGFIFFNDEFPNPTPQDSRIGTYMNGITKYGIGAEIAINPGTKILFGAQHVHVSNGNSKGVERNPSHDSNGFYLGFTTGW